MKKDQLKKGNEILKKIERVETEHLKFRNDMSFGKMLPEGIKISASSNLWSQTEITDEILIAVILKEVDNRFLGKISELKAKFKNI